MDVVVLVPFKPPSLTAKQREVMNLVVAHHSNKEIARILNISERRVEQQMQTIRERLQASSRNDAARIWAPFVQPFGKPEGGETDLPPAFNFSDDDGRAGFADASFTLRDSAPVSPSRIWEEAGSSETVPGKLFDQLGIKGRILIVPIMSVAVAVIILLLLTVAETVDRLITLGFSSSTR